MGALVTGVAVGLLVVGIEVGDNAGCKVGESVVGVKVGWLETGE